MSFLTALLISTALGQDPLQHPEIVKRVAHESALYRTCLRSHYPSSTGPNHDAAVEIAKEICKSQNEALRATYIFWLVTQGRSEEDAGRLFEIYRDRLVEGSF